MSRVYAYIRVSTVKQGERGSSLQEQRSAIEAYAQRRGLTILEWFEEKETAAKSGRRGFTRMLRLLQRGKADGVVIHKIDRGARNLRDWADLGELIDQGIEVHFANESLDLNSRGGRLSADIQAVVASDYIRNLRDEVRKGFYGRLKQGVYPLPAPLGYKDEGAGKPKSLDPVTAPLVRKAFELYATCRYNIDTLGDELYRLGLRTGNGTRMSRGGLAKLLNSQFYIGLIHIRRTGETFQGKHRPLISKSLFDRVQAVLSGKAQTQGLRRDFLYRRRLRCVHCGYLLIAETQKRRPYYRCHTRACPTTCLREDAIDDLIRDVLGCVRLTPRELELLAEDFAKRLEGSAGYEREMAEGVRLNIEKLESRLARLTDAYIDRLIDKTTFEERKASLLHERTGLREKLDELTSGAPVLESRVGKFLELVKSLSGNADPINREENCDLVKTITSNLGVDQKNLVVTWNSLFAPIAFRSKSTYGGPQRYTARTFSVFCDDEARRKNRSIEDALTVSESEPDHTWRDEVWERLREKLHKDRDETSNPRPFPIQRISPA